jgi:hypothetical protein
MTEQFKDFEPLYKQGWNDERKLLLKLSQILGEVGAIPKTGFNSFHKYYYHSEADINSAFQGHFFNHKIMFSASMIDSEMRTTLTGKGNTEYIYKANMRFTFFDAETGESLTGCMSGEGQDNGDKALYKSISGTQKYILMKTFMVTDHMDPEGDPTVDERNSGKASTPSKPSNQPITPPPPQNGNTGQTGTSGGAITARVYKLREELKWEWADLNKFASQALGREIKYLKNDVKTAEDWEKIEKDMLELKAAS